MEFGQSDHFKSWAKAKGAALCPTVNYNHTLNSESKCYVRITKEHLRCTFGSYYIGHLPRKSKLVENTTLDDCGLDGAFLVSDHSTPTFWMWSFKSNKPMKMCDGVFYPTYPFRDPSILQHPAWVISHTRIFVLCTGTKPTAVSTKTMSRFRNMTCALTQRRCTTHPVPLHRFNADSKWTHLTC